jgi:hypothetical protein
VRATAREFTGVVQGTVTANAAAVANATVELLTAGTAIGDQDATKILRTTSTNATGGYMFAFVPPGTYTLRVTPPSVLALQPALVATVTVTSDNTTTVPAVALTP